MENIALPVIYLLIAIILFLFVAIGILLYLLLSQKKQAASIEIIPADNNQNSKAMCQFHQKEPAQAVCSICSCALCASCIRLDEPLTFCPEHFRLYLDNKWKVVTRIHTTPVNPNDGIKLYEFKDQLWQLDQTPTYLITEYKINVEGDQIESFVELFSIEEDVESIKSKFDKNINV